MAWPRWDQQALVGSRWPPGARCTSRPGSAGLSVVRSKGGYARLPHPDGGAVALPVRPGDLRGATLAAILKGAQVSPEREPLP
jgi:predicted RNA binding protein YcfA (HicA-like mRNA interferase family)